RRVGSRPHRRIGHARRAPGQERLLCRFVPEAVARRRIGCDPVREAPSLCFSLWQTDPRTRETLNTYPEYRDDVNGVPVRGFLHGAGNSDGDWLILTHGAGSNCNAPLLVAVSEAFAP